MLVGFVHGILTDACEIMDAIIHIIINYTFDGGDTLVLNGKHAERMAVETLDACMCPNG